jgi:hypothetical protein
MLGKKLEFLKECIIGNLRILYLSILIITSSLNNRNTVTDETTAIGAPRPTGSIAAAVQQPQSPSLMSTMAEGAAWGVGMSVARNVVGNMFGVSLPGSDDDDETHSV